MSRCLVFTHCRNPGSYGPGSALLTMPSTPTAAQLAIQLNAIAWSVVDRQHVLGQAEVLVTLRMTSPRDVSAIDE